MRPPDPHRRGRCDGTALNRDGDGESDERDGRKDRADGVSPNVGSFVSAATVCEHVMGFESKPPTDRQLEEMKELVRREMEKGAFGVTSALIYAPAQYASTDELIELARGASRYRGKFIAHMRSGGTGCSRPSTR